MRGGAEPNDFERAFSQGADGEEQVGRELNAEWERWGGFGVLHSIVRPEGGDIDHIVVGPAGVTVIDTKNWSDRAWVGRRVVGRGRRAHRECVNGVLSQTEAVRARLFRSGLDGIPVAGALCFVQGTTSGGLQTVDGVSAGDIWDVRRFAVRGGAVELVDQQAAFAALAEHFDVTGGSKPPVASVRRPNVGSWPRRNERPSRWHALAKRSTRLVLALALIPVLLAVALLAASLVSKGASRALAPMGQHELVQHLPDYHRLAVQRAHGRVHGLRIHAVPGQFRVSYRGSHRCRVTITVSRAARLFGGGGAVVSSTGCRSRKRA